MEMRRWRNRRPGWVRSSKSGNALLCFVAAMLLAGAGSSAQTPADASGDIPSEPETEPGPNEGEGPTATDPAQDTPFTEIITETISAEDPDETAEDGDRLIWEDSDELMSREVAYLEFKAHMESEEYPQARDAAQLVVELTAEEFGPDHVENVTPLNNLATIQEQLGEYRAAEANYLKTVRILEDHEGFYGERLVRSLMGLGITYNAAGQYPEGLLAFQRAQHITHRREGVYNLDQLDIIDGQTQSFLGLDEFAEADRSQRLVLVISERKLGKHSIELVPALLKLAKWYQSTYQYANQRILYRRALTILEANKGPDDLSLVEPLRGIATSRYLEGIRRSEGEDALERALEIVSKHPDVESEERVRTLVDLGDWYLTSSKADQGLPLYQEAWGLLHRNIQLRDTLFGKPVRLLYYSPVVSESEPLSVSDEPGDKYIDLEFMVTRRGRVANVKVIDSNVRNVIQREVKFAIAKARYRPRLEAGVSVDTPLVKFRQSFKGSSSSASTDESTTSRAATLQ